MDRDLEELWPAAEPPAGFAGRVVERTLSEPMATERPSRGQVPRSWARRAAAVLSIAAVIATTLVGWRLHQRDHGEVFSAEAREIAIGERATALLSKGAHLEWSAAGVRQDRGDIEYRVQPGGAFVVQTPFGRVQVLGTIFRVRIGAAQPEEPSMKTSKWTIAASGGLTAGVLLYVAVREGTVRLSNADRQISLAPGEAGGIGADGIPVRMQPMAAAPGPNEHAEVAAGPTSALRQPERQRRAFDRLRADGIRERAAAGSAALHDRAPGSPSAAAGAAGVSAALTPQEEERRRQYIRAAVREQYFPIARSCYEELLQRQPQASGKIVMSFAIVGDGDAGVVDRVEPDDGTTMDDPEFILCMRESMYSTVFEPPPPGARETTVTYPIVLEPGDRENDTTPPNPAGKVLQNSH